MDKISYFFRQQKNILNNKYDFVQQNILFRVREEKYRSRINVLETLASGTTDENEVLILSLCL